MRYEIEPATFAVSIFNGAETIPFWLQPTYPNGDLFDSVAEATAWADLAVASHVDAIAPYPPKGKGLVGEPKPTAEQIAAWNASR
ncbi:hypothetical protein UFOVP1616_58 [uncultured Caudovirales phage]|uniref:Uncharacterized protein n=1 Tax=uncultured Caudovirales phage TaxID=2100421 RepID=A0A6J5SJY2_9CAUD|nr:hypothetical protein UFOVP1467_11 [uncultured Caudovirales phage]CAB4219677.1 hypothetical protein UFOVP1616_58 [uncultured Caudovirales phage]